MKNTVVALITVLVLSSILLGVVYYKNNHDTSASPVCPTDVMMCPDGSSVKREGTKCEFSVCKQDLPAYLQKETSASSQETEQADVSSSSIKEISISQGSLKIIPKNTSTFFKKITEPVTSFFSQEKASVSSKISEGVSETSQVVSSDKKVAAAVYEQIVTASQKPTINETRYDIEKNSIVSATGTIIYTLPVSTATSSPSSNSWATHVVNVVPVNQVAPIIGAIPVSGLPGKYYLSENSFGSIEGCEFSNKIYILDTNNGSKTLMYEENSSTLAHDDPRACSSEMYLLATENENLILKYHTIGTNMVCDSTWSEPEKTWYLDVTKLSLGMRRYVISSDLYTKAEVEEAFCRSGLDNSQATTQQ